jgi:hypothetical protein
MKWTQFLPSQAISHLVAGDDWVRFELHRQAIAELHSENARLQATIASQRHQLADTRHQLELTQNQLEVAGVALARRDKPTEDRTEDLTVALWLVFTLASLGCWVPAYWAGVKSAPVLLVPGIVVSGFLAVLTLSLFAVRRKEGVR